MKHSSLTILLSTLLSCVIPCTLMSIDPLSLLGGPLAKEGVDKVKEYWYSSEKQGKRILRKHLNCNKFTSAIASGCNEDFSEDCAELAKYFETMEKYHASHNEILCIQHQIKLLKHRNLDTKELEEKVEELKKQEPTISYFESLDSSEQQSIFALERRLSITYAQPEKYQGELEIVHKALHQ